MAAASTDLPGDPLGRPAGDHPGRPPLAPAPQPPPGSTLAARLPPGAQRRSSTRIAVGDHRARALALVQRIGRQGHHTPVGGLGQRHPHRLGQRVLQVQRAGQAPAGLGQKGAARDHLPPGHQRLPPLASGLGRQQLAPDGGPQPGQVVGEHVVVRPGLDGLDRRLFTQPGRHDDDRDVQFVVLQQLQRRQRTELAACLLTRRSAPDPSRGHPAPARTPAAR